MPNLQIEPKIPVLLSALRTIASRKPDYVFIGGGIYDIKPWRPTRNAFNRSAQFRDIQAATGQMPVPLYYRLKVPR